MKAINTNLILLKKVILLLILFLCVINFSSYASLSSPNNIENSSNDSNIEKEIKEDTKKIAYLTFDDGPSKNTELILDILKDNNVHATFFIISPYIEPHIKFVKRAYDEGNAIGNHTADHEFQYVYTCEESFFKSFN
ncbi:MAG: polysaccharide deacetylase family protein, partial [Clostridium celatum]|nr:polysaccharide deacetylase family protein [Clostridium celatum]